MDVEVVSEKKLVGTNFIQLSTHFTSLDENAKKHISSTLNDYEINQLILYSHRCAHFQIVDNSESWIQLGLSSLAIEDFHLDFRDNFNTWA